MKKLLTVICLTGALALVAQTAEAKGDKGKSGEAKGVKKELLEKYDTNKDGKLDKEEKAKISEEDKAKFGKSHGKGGEKKKAE